MWKVVERTSLKSLWVTKWLVHAATPSLFLIKALAVELDVMELDIWRSFQRATKHIKTGFTTTFLVSQGSFTFEKTRRLLLVCCLFHNGSYEGNDVQCYWGQWCAMTWKTRFETWTQWNTDVTCHSEALAVLLVLEVRLTVELEVVTLLKRPSNRKWKAEWSDWIILNRIILTDIVCVSLWPSISY